MDIKVGKPCKIETEMGLLLGNIVEVDGTTVTFSTPHNSRVIMDVLTAAIRLQPVTERELVQITHLHQNYAGQLEARAKALAEAGCSDNGEPMLFLKQRIEAAAKIANLTEEE